MSGIAIRSSYAAMPGEAGIKGNVLNGQEVFNMLLGKKRYFMRTFIPRRLQKFRRLVDRLEGKIGIETRNILNDDSIKFPTTYILTEAGKGTLEKAGVNPKNVQGLIVATDTPDLIFSSPGIEVAKLLGINPRQFGNTSMACVSIADVLERACSWIINNNWCDNVLILAGDITSKMRLLGNRIEPFLFGDGGVGIYLEKAKTSEKGERTEKGGFTFSNLSVDTSQADLFIHRHIYSGDVGLFNSALLENFQDNDTGLDLLGDIDAIELPLLLSDWLINSGDVIDKNTKIILPQTGKQVIENGIKKFKEISGIDITGNVIENTSFKKHGNIGAGAIPLAWHEAIKEGKIDQETHSVLFVIAGVGGVKTVFKRDPNARGIEHLPNYRVHARPDYRALIEERASENKRKSRNGKILSEMYGSGDNGTYEIDFKPVRNITDIERVVKSNGSIKS